ncbi:MAG: OmpA family protein [Rubrivivax sp.]|nr:OmpA family protein [Rubrivivax sp.]
MLVLSGCASPPENLSPAAAATAAPQPAPAPPPAAPAPSGQPQGVAASPGADGRGLGSQVATVTAPAPDSVFFEFDDSALRVQDTPVIERFGKYLAAARGAGLRVEGHCDERGSREYNLALGQRRAQAVVNALRAIGIDTARIEAVSFGEERPRATGRDEASWAQNRRADLRARAAP